MRSYSIVSRDGEVAQVDAWSDREALLDVADRMGLADPEITGTYRLVLPGGTKLYAREVATA